MKKKTYNKEFVGCVFGIVQLTILTPLWLFLMFNVLALVAAPTWLFVIFWTYLVAIYVLAILRGVAEVGASE